MSLNITALLLIALLPLLLGFGWYHPKFALRQRWAMPTTPPISAPLVLALWLLSALLMLGYANLIIHQIGFYELFLTDIVTGNEASKAVANEFLAKYGDKHRHFGHGAFHGAINAVALAMPFIATFTLLYRHSFRHFVYHFLYWLLTSILVGGLISAWV